MFHLYFNLKVAHAPETYNRATLPLLCAVAMGKINLPQIHLLTKGLCFTPPDVGCSLCQVASLRVLSSCTVRTTSSNEPTNQPNNQMLTTAASRRASLLHAAPDYNPRQGSNHRPTDQLTITGIWNRPTHHVRTEIHVWIANV